MERFRAPGVTLMIPWPVLYEALNTQFIERVERVNRLDRDLLTLTKTGQLSLKDDTMYREEALQECFREAARTGAHYWALSLVDRILRKMIADPQNKIDGLITYDLRGFSDVPQKFRKELISE